MGLFGRKQKRKLSKEEERMKIMLQQMEAQRQSFIRNGYSQYQIIGTGDECNICRSMKGNCRCSVAAYMDKGKYDRWIDALSKGKNVRYKDFK